MKCINRPIAVFAVLFWTSIASAQFPIHSVIRGNQTAQFLGSVVANVGDINLDGVNDLIIGAPGTRSNPLIAGEGAVELISGMDGSRIWARYGLNPADAFGSAVAAGFDSNGDGISEIAVGAPRYDRFVNDDGAVFILDGVTKRIVGTLFGLPRFGALFGSHLATIGDIDGDNIADLMVGAKSTSFLLGGEGYVKIYSGRTLRVIRSHRGANLFDNFGVGLTGLPDIDNDEVPDYAIGIPNFDAGGSNRGAVSIYSGRDGHFIHRLKSKYDQSQFGATLCSMEIPGQPNSSRLFVGSPTNSQAGTSGGKVEVFSLTEFQRIRTILPNASSSRFGTSLANGGDLNGDGIDDILVGAIGDNFAAPIAGSVELFSGVDLSSLAKIFGDGPNAALGTAVAGLGDINDDGIGDFAMGSWASGSAPLEGSVTLMSYMGVDLLPNPPSAVGLQWMSGSELGNAREADGGLLATDIPGRRSAMLAAFATPGATGPIYVASQQAFSREIFLMPASGSRLFPVDLTDPSMAGVTVTMQVIRWPLMNQVSPGYNLLFGG